MSYKCYVTPAATNGIKVYHRDDGCLTGRSATKSRPPLVHMDEETCKALKLTLCKQCESAVMPNQVEATLLDILLQNQPYDAERMTDVYNLDAVRNVVSDLGGHGFEIKKVRR